MLVQYGSILNKQKMKQSSKILSLEKIPNCNKFDVSIIILKIIQNAKYTNDRTISLKLCSGTGFFKCFDVSIEWPQICHLFHLELTFACITFAALATNSTSASCRPQKAFLICRL